MEENLNKKLKNKGYICETVCKCKVHQIKNLGIKEENIPNSKDDKRIGIIWRLAVIKKEVEKKNKPIEEVETEITVLKKFISWHESLGIAGNIVVILERTEKIISNIEEIEDNLGNIVKFVPGDEELNEYDKEIILIGIKSLFELGKISYWDKTVYFLYDTDSTGKSAGVPLLLAFYSAYFRIGIPSGLSATGWIDKEGNIKGVGGLKEKLICAFRNTKIDSLILPQENYEYVSKTSDTYSKLFIKSKKLILYSVNHWKGLVDLLLQWKG